MLVIGLSTVIGKRKRTFLDSLGLVSLVLGLYWVVLLFFCHAASPLLNSGARVFSVLSWLPLVDAPM